MYFEDEGGRRSFCYCSAFDFFGGGQLDRNQEVGFKYFEFEISCRHPGGNVKQAVGHMSLGLEETLRLKVEMWESSVYKWDYSHETIEIN